MDRLVDVNHPRNGWLMVFEKIYNLLKKPNR